MNQKWRILLGICLVVMVCVPVVSTALQIPTIKHSYSRPSLEQFKVAKDTPYTFENNRISDGIPSLQLSDSFGETSRAEISVLVTDIPNPEITDRFLGGLWAPRIWRTGTISSTDIYITEDEAIAIALAQYPDIVLLQPIKATLKRINAPAYPLAKNLCWEVEIIGINPYEGDLVISDTGEKSTGIYTCYGGILIIDAVTGEIFYKLIPASDYI